MTQKHSYTAREEAAHAITHGIGALLALVGLVLLLQHSIAFGDIWHIASSAIYGGCLVALYACSTIYHAAPPGGTKAKLQKLDHAAIYIMIAGSYTPITLISLHGVYGWTIFSVVWVLAIAGLCMDLLAKKRHHKIAITLYLGMGWIILLVIKPLIASLAVEGIWLLLAGGISYTVGVAFYVWHALKYHHVIWHLFVLAGSAFQYFAVLFYMVPMQ